MNHNNSTRTCDTGILDLTRVIDDNSTAMPIDNYTQVLYNRHERRKQKALERKKVKGLIL